ncbi:MAG: class I SAM-dependent methyltransferase [Anaerolineae bacterium]|nr:class I SAM-dependent methyltransferase [Anaerolineae bacterium]
MTPDWRAPTSYDETPYPSLSYAQSHPDRLATIATILGLQPPALARCRVLELGCAGGGNLIPMAYGLPEARFVGLDNSPRQIAEGQAMIAALDLSNVSLECQDILKVGPELGCFDYIIAHGVFSWVPRQVQDKLLDLCGEHLAPDGVAYVSYNTYPGWHFVGAMREMMLYHTRHAQEPLERVRQARELLELLARAIPPDSGAYGTFLNTYARFLSGEPKGQEARDDAFLLHDELEEYNEPIYFHQFMERASRRGLRYLGEAEFSAMTGDHFDAQTLQKLDQLTSGVVELEQYMDFLRNRTFRQTLLCHQDLEPSRTLRPQLLSRLHVASHARPAEPVLDIHADEVVRFEGSDGAIFSTDHPPTKAAMLYLEMVWPRAVPVDDLVALALGQTRRPIGGEAETEANPQDELALQTNLLKAFSYSSSLVKLHVHAPCLAIAAGERPVASAVARYGARTGALVTNLRHERVQLEPLDRLIIQRLDGEHNRQALLAELLAGPVAQGAITLARGGQPGEDPVELREIAAEEIDNRLTWLAHAALLEE